MPADFVWNKLKISFLFYFLLYILCNFTLFPFSLNLFFEKRNLHTCFVCRLSITDPSRSGPRVRSSMWSSTPDPATSGCPPSSAPSGSSPAVRIFVTEVVSLLACRRVDRGFDSQLMTALDTGSHFAELYSRGIHLKEAHLYFAVVFLASQHPIPLQLPGQCGTLPFSLTLSSLYVKGRAYLSRLGGGGDGRK